MPDDVWLNYPIIIVRHIVIGTVTACVSPIISSSISSSISSDDALPLSVTPLSLYDNNQNKEEKKS